MAHVPLARSDTRKGAQAYAAKVPTHKGWEASVVRTVRASRNRLPHTSWSVVLHPVGEVPYVRITQLDGSKKEFRGRA